MDIKTLGRKVKGLDDESGVAIFHGMSISQMSKLFEMERRDISEKIEKAGIKPCGKNGPWDIYKLKEVMPAVVKPLYDVESYLLRMNPADLPKTLSKEFWAAQRSKQEFDLKAGNLWPTEKVVTEAGELFKLFKMSLLLMVDTVERQVELTEEQRNIIKRMADGTLLDLHRAVVEKFSSKAVKNEAAEDDQEL